MKYRNASEVLPDSLLRELQKYAPGELLYIPADSGRKNQRAGGIETETGQGCSLGVAAGAILMEDGK